MNQFYNGVKHTLLTWALGDKPANVTLRVAAVKSTYVFDPAHAVIADADKLKDLSVEATVVNGVVRLPDFVISDLTPTDTLKALVLYFSWTGGIKLVAYIDTATDLSLPIFIEQPSLQVKWDAAGVFRI